MSLSWEINVKGDFREFCETNTSSKQEINLKCTVGSELSTEQLKRSIQ